jgi:DNA-binding transcriptional regulator PaaX
MSPRTYPKEIPRPEITVAQIILLMLAEKGRLDFKAIVAHPTAKSLGLERTENSFYTALARLKQRKHIIRTSDRKYELTEIGEYAALKAYVRKAFTEGEKKLKEADERESKTSWDGRWRFIFFDIPETKRPLRDYLRGVLKRLGCKEFQRSMWIYPYKLPSFVLRFLSDPQLRKYARVITTYDIDYDEDLRKHFKLK